MFVEAGARGRGPLPAAQSRQPKKKKKVGGAGRAPPRSAWGPESRESRRSRGRRPEKRGLRAPAAVALRFTSDPSWQPWRQPGTASAAPQEPSPSPACADVGVLEELRNVDPTCFLRKTSPGPPVFPLVCPLTGSPAAARSPPEAANGQLGGAERRLRRRGGPPRPSRPISARAGGRGRAVSRRGRGFKFDWKASLKGCVTPGGGSGPAALTTVLLL